LISQRTVQQILDTAQIVDVVEDFVNLKRRGSNMIGLCPFHDEKTPSFTVSPSKNISKCFGCGKGGSPVNFIMEHEGLSFPEALRWLAKKYNIPIEETEQTQEEKESKEIRDSLFIVNDFAQKYFEQQLFETPMGKSVGLSYFKERGYREATIKKFNLGFAPSGRDKFTQTAIQAKYNIDYLRMVGLTTKNDIDFFRDRVMFTIHNLSGKIVAFAGRTLSTEKKIPKYINSPETEIYNKRKVLYGLYQAKKAVRNEDECILVEGYTDVITLHQGGIENVVASSGTALTTDQIRLIKRYTPNIKIIYDGDPAGIKAALRGLDLVLEQDMNVKLILLPDGEDPDSFLKSQGRENFKKYLEEEEQDFIFFKVNLLAKEAGNDPIKKSNVIKDIVRSIAKIPDMMKRSLYLTRCSSLLGIDEQILVAEANKAIKHDIRQKRIESDRKQLRAENLKIEEERWLATQAQPSGYQSEANKTVVPPGYWQEKDIVRVLISFGDRLYQEDQEVTVAEYILTNLEDIENPFKNDLFNRIIQHCTELVNKGAPVVSSYFINHADSEMSQLAVDIIASPHSYADWEERGVMLQTQKLPEENFVRDAFQSVMRFKLHKVKEGISEIQAQLKHPEELAEQGLSLETLIKVLQLKMNERNEIARQLSTIIL
jgi:DNA primase